MFQFTLLTPPWCLEARHRKAVPPLIGIIAIVGYSIKPTVIFMLLAIIVVNVVWPNKEIGIDNNARKKIRLKECLSCMGMLSLGIVIGFSIVGIIKTYSDDVNETNSMPMTHFLMMGANKESGDAYSGTDVKASLAISNKEDRIRFNINVWHMGVSNMEPLGAVEFYGKKML